jgi:hypothetical protein
VGAKVIFYQIEASIKLQPDSINKGRRKMLPGAGSVEQGLGFQIFDLRF